MASKMIEKPYCLFFRCQVEFTMVEDVWCGIGWAEACTIQRYIVGYKKNTGDKARRCWKGES